MGEEVWLAANFYIHFGWEISVMAAVDLKAKVCHGFCWDSGLLNFFDYAEWKGGP